jgi:flagellar motor protein MotB
MRDPGVVAFPSGGNVFRLTPDLAAQLLPAALTAKRVDISARNDAVSAGSKAANDAVALARGVAAKAYLVSKGVKDSIIFINAQGEGDYVANNKTPEGRAANRRVEIRIIEKRASTH